MFDSSDKEGKTFILRSLCSAGPLKTLGDLKTTTASELEIAIPEDVGYMKGNTKVWLCNDKDAAEICTSLASSSVTFGVPLQVERNLMHVRVYSSAANH